jgi:hypothetical protein
MPRTLIAVNPRLVAGPVMETRTMLVDNGTSWKAGQFLFLNTTGELDTCASDADAGTGGIKFYALTDQANPGADGTYAEVGVIHPDHVFEINELDGAVDQANIGQIYGIDVTSNVVTVDEGDTSNPALKVIAVASDYNPAQNLVDDVKGRCRVQVIASVIDAATA